MNISFDTNIFIAGIQATNPFCVSALDALDRIKGRFLISGIVEKEVLRNLAHDEAVSAVAPNVGLSGRSCPHSG